MSVAGVTHPFNCICTSCMQGRYQPVEVEPLKRSFTALTGGEHPEIDRLAILWQILSEADHDERQRVLIYLQDRCACECRIAIGGSKQ